MLLNVVLDQGIAVVVVVAVVAVVVFRPNAIFYDSSLMGNSKNTHKRSRVILYQTGQVCSQICPFLMQ